VFTPPEVSGYVIREVLGQGGFATVYLATQVAVGRDVALKIDNRVVTSERDQRRFFREVNSAGRLSDHPHVVGLYDAGTLPDGRPYLVMELCSGGSLANLVQARGSLPPDEVRDLGIRIADALGAAHQLGVLHRDIKPGNILINRYGTVGLADFGLASVLAPDREQSATLEALTPAFAAPEAFALAEPAAPADVYSLGATLYALLAGRPPRFPDVGSPSIPTILRLHHEPVPVLPWVPAPLMNVILRSLASDPADRYPDGTALRDALAELPAEVRTSRLDEPSRPSVPSLNFPTPPISSFANGAGYPSRPNLPAQAPFPTGPAAPIPAGPIPAAPIPASAVPAGLALGSSALLRVAGAALLVVGLTVGILVTVKPFGSNDPKDSSSSQLPAGQASTPGSSGSGASDKTVDGVNFGVSTVECAAVGSDGTGGRCTKDAECWSGMVVVVGKVEITREPCEDRHRWETFAIAPLPPDALTSNQQKLAAHPEVKKLCTKKVMGKLRNDKARKVPAAKWMVDVLPPSEKAYDEGARVYRCVAAVISSDGTKGSAFTTVG
jgi:serine/threonine protein kinase